MAFITGAGPRTQEIVSNTVHPFTVQPSLESFEEVVVLITTITEEEAHRIVEGSIIDDSKIGNKVAGRRIEAKYGPSHPFSSSCPNSYASDL